MHTNFKIAQSKPNPEYIVFSDPVDTILEGYNLHGFKTQMNHSWWRTSNGAATWNVFTTPTPNAANNTTAFQSYTEMPVFNINGGFFPGSVTISISTNEPNAVIRYTTNGDTPDATSIRYTPPKYCCYDSCSSRGLQQRPHDTFRYF